MSGFRLAQLTSWVDAGLAWLKWPVVVVAVAFLPGAVMAIGQLGYRIVQAPRPLAPFLVGMAAWLVLWWLIVRHSRFSFFLTLEHELTHAVFAWLTLHRVVGLRVTLTQGGHVKYAGRGNWLISIAPYFWPTASLVVLGVVWLLPSAAQPIGQGVLGASLAWHITGTLRETHPKQTDLQQVGLPFSALFLPTANLVAIGGVLAFAYAGGGGLQQFVEQVGAGSWWAATRIVSGPVVSTPS